MGIERIVPQWEETKERFRAWWAGTAIRRPLIRMVARKPGYSAPVPKRPTDPQSFHVDLDFRFSRYQSYISNHDFLADSFPNTTINMGAGSMALYLGSEPTFDFNTVWFNKTIGDWNDAPSIQYLQNNGWWRTHVDLIRAMTERAQGSFPIAIPDIIENMDILASLRGTEELCIDLMDQPLEIRKRLAQLDNAYIRFYDVMYDIVKMEDESSCFTSFQIWGPGKVVKIQCDFSAMLSPELFAELVVPSLAIQCGYTDYSLYHLDGPDAIRHVDSLMSISALNALQWTAGAGQPDGGCDRWYGIYDKVRSAGKSLHISIYDGNADQMFDSADRIINRYGRDGIYFLFPEMDGQTAGDFLARAGARW